MKRGGRSDKAVFTIDDVSNSSPVLDILQLHIIRMNVRDKHSS